MPLTVNFGASQDISTPENVTISDTSVGTDVSIVERRVFLLQANGDYLVPSGTDTDYIVWSNSGSSTLEIEDVFDKDYAISCTVQWLDSTDTVIYTKTILFAFTAYSETGYSELISDQSSYPRILNDPSYVANLSKLRLFIDSAEQAVEFGEDIYKSQRALDFAKDMLDNEQLYF
jgi:hypothetical protein